MPGAYDDGAHGVDVTVAGHTTVDGGMYHGVEGSLLFPPHCFAVGSW